MDKQKASYGIDERALRSAAPWLRSCPEIVLGGINAQLLGGLTSKSDTIYVQCKCPSCSSKPGLGLHNLVEHVAHVTDEDMPANICRTVLFFQAEGGTQTPFKTYRKLVGQQYNGREVIGSNIWLFRFDKDTTAAAGAAAGAGVWVEAEVVGYNEKSGEHEVQFSEGSPLPGQRVKIFIGLTHIHFGTEAPANGEAPNRTPPGGLAFEDVPGQPKQHQKQVTPAAPARALKPVSTGRAAAAAATPGGTRSPSKRQAALAAPAHWAAAGIPTSAAAVAAAKRPAAAAAAAAGSGGSKKPRTSSGNGSMAHPGGYPVVLNLGGVGGGPNHHQRHMMMYATHAQQMLGDGGLGAGYGHDRRLGRPPSGNMGPEPQSKTSRFRGVSWNKRTLKWQVTLYARGRYRYFGSYTNQEEAACAYDRAALVWKGPSAQLNYPASTYLKGNQKQALQLLQEQAQQEAAKGNEPPPELPAGEAGTAALAAVAAKEEAAAAAAAGLGGHGSRGVSPAATAAAATGVRVSARRRGSSSSEHADLAIKPEAAAEPAAAAAAAAADGEQDEDIPPNIDELSDGLEGDGGSDLEGDQAGGTVSNTPGGEGGAGGWVSLGGFKKKRKRKAQGKLFTRKKIHKQELPMLSPTSMQAYAANGLYPPPGLPKPAAAKAPEQLPPLSKEQQLVAAATAAAAAAAAAGRAVGAAKRKPGRPPKEHIRQAQAAAAEPQLLAAAAVAAGVKQVKPDRPSSAGGGVKLERGGSADSSDGQQQQEPGSTRRSSRRKQQQLPQGEAAVDKSEGPAEAAEKLRRSKRGSSTPDSDKAAAADGDAAAAGEAATATAAAVAASEGAGAASGSEGGASGEGEGEEGDAEGGEGGSGAEEDGAITTRRSQRQAARKAQKKTARRMASVVNARSDGLWARLMQRAGSDAGSSDEEDSAGVDSLGLERGDIEAMAAAAQAAGLPRDAVLSAHEAALKMLESSTAGRGRSRGRGRGRRGQGRRGRPPGSGIAARMAELHAQFLALGGMYPAAGRGDKGPARDDTSQGLGPAGSEDLEGLAEAVEQLSAHDGEGSVGEDDQGLDEDLDMDDVDLGDDDADVAALLLGLTGGSGRSREAAAAGDEYDQAEGDGGDQDAAAAAAAAAAEYDGETEHADRDSFAGGNGHLLHQAFTDGLASHKTAGGRVMPLRDRGYNSKYDDMEDWQPRSARGRARGRGRSTRGRAAAASYAAAAAAASYSGQEQQQYYAAQQQYGRGLGRAIRGRPRASPLGGYGSYGPGTIGMPGLGYPYWQQQQHVAAAGMPMNSAAFAMPGIRWPNPPGQQQHGEDGGSGSEAEGDEQQQQQPPALDQAAAEELLNKSNPQQVAQHFVQVMFMAFTTGAPQYLQEFQALYAALCNSPAHMQKVMAMLFQFGTQMGASIAASGGAPTVAAAFSNMAAMAGMGGMHDMSHMAAAASAADMLAQQMQAAAAAGVAANGSMAPPAAAAVTPTKAAVAAAADDGSKTTATADGAAAAAGSAVKAPAAAAAAARGSVPSLRAPWPLIPPGMTPSGFPPGAGLPGFHPAMAAAAAASMPPDYMRLMMGLGLPLEESDESESEQDDEDVEVTRMAAGAAAAAAKPTEAKAAAAPATGDHSKAQAAGSVAPKSATATEGPAAAAAGGGDGGGDGGGGDGGGADKQEVAVEVAGHDEEPGTAAAAAASSEEQAARAGSPSATEGPAPADGSLPAVVTGAGVAGTTSPAAAALSVDPATSAAMPAVKDGDQPAGVASPAAAASSPRAAVAGSPAIHPAAMVPPAAAAAISAMPPETTAAAAASMPIASSTAMMMQHSQMAPAAIGYQQPSGYYVVPTAAGFVAMPGVPRTTYGHMPMQQHMQMQQQIMMQQQQPQQYVLAQFMPQQQQQQHMLMQQQQMMQQQQKRGLNLQQPAQPITQPQLMHPIQPMMMQQQQRGQQQHPKPQVPPVVLNLAAAAPSGQHPQQQVVSLSSAVVGAPPRQPQTPATALGGVSGHVLALDLAPPAAEDPLSTTAGPLAAAAVPAAEPDLDCSTAADLVGNQVNTPHAAAVPAVDTPAVMAPLAHAAVGPGGSPPLQGYVMHPGAPPGVTCPAGSVGVPVSGIDIHKQPTFTAINGHGAH